MGCMFCSLFTANIDAVTMVHGVSQPSRCKMAPVSMFFSSQAQVVLTKELADAKAREQELTMFKT